MSGRIFTIRISSAGNRQSHGYERSDLYGGTLRGSTFLKFLNAGDINGAADELPKWNKAAGRVLEGLTSGGYSCHVTGVLLQKE